MSELLTKTDDVGQEEKSRRNWRGFILRIAGSLFVLGLLYWFLPKDKLLKAFEAFSLTIWASGVGCYLCLHLIGVAKWRMLVNAAGADLGWVQACRCYYYGLFGNTFLPSVVGGDIIRAGLAFKLSRSKSAVLMGSVVDRTIDSLGLALVAGIGALLIPMSLDENSRNIFWGFALVLIVAGLLLLAALWMLAATRLNFKWRRRLVKIRRSARLLLQSPDKVMLALFAVIVLQTAQVVMSVWLGRLAKIVSVGFFAWLFVWPVAKLSAMAPLTQGGIGVREAVQGTLFVPFGVSIEKAVAAGLMFQAIVIAGNLFGGLLAWLLGRLSSGTLLEKTQDAQTVSTLPLALGLGLFFLANTLALAFSSFENNSQDLMWMSYLPGYEASFAGGVVGLGYGLFAGWLLNNFYRIKTSWK